MVRQEIFPLELKNVKKKTVSHYQETNVPENRVVTRKPLYEECIKNNDGNRREKFELKLEFKNFVDVVIRQFNGKIVVSRI